MKKVMTSMCVMALTMTATYSYAGADEAKVAFDTMTAQTQKLFKNWESSLVFKTLSLETTEYKESGDHATATQVMKIVFNPSKKKDNDKKVADKITYTFNYDVFYASPENGDVVAHIKTTDIKRDSSDPEMRKQAFDATVDSQIVDIYKNGNVHYHSLTIDGARADVNWHGHLDTLDKLYGTFEGMIEDDKSSESSLDRFGFKGEHTAENGFTLISTTPMESTKDDRETKIESMTFNGKFVDVDGVAQPLPSVSWLINGISIENVGQPKMTMKEIRLGMNANQNEKGEIDVAAMLNVKPDGDWVKTLSQGKFDFSNFDLNVSIDSMPKSMFNEFSNVFVQGVQKGYESGDEKDAEFDEAIDDAMEDAFDKHGEAWFAAMQKNGFGPKVAIKLDTDKGNGFLNLGAHFKDAGMTLEALDEKKPDAKMLTSLINIAGESKLPAELVEALQVQMFLAMAYKKEGDAYVSNIETKDGQVLVNGVPFDLSMFLPK